MRRGKPIGTLSYIFMNLDLPPNRYEPPEIDTNWDPVGIRPEEAEKYATADLRLFGTFCMTQAGRLCFFPGFVGEDYTRYRADGAVHDRKRFPLDHLTLDPTGWHVTAMGEIDAEHTTMGDVFQLTPTLNYWFSVAINLPSGLERVYRYNSQYFDAPRSDAERQRALVEAANSGGTNNIVTPSDGRTKPDVPCFLNIDVFVQRGPPEPSAITGVRLPSASQMELLDAPAKLPVRLHSVFIGDFNGVVWLDAGLFTGRIRNHPVLLATGPFV